ncbi:hypothetical protein C2E23DRAFT_904603 [Lenzites betulinus]|nr:hypothetical protein C2E23DRAFT_904603 [Lenzites betulinus]
MSMKAIVKCMGSQRVCMPVPYPEHHRVSSSGDLLLLCGNPGPQGPDPKECILHLADIQTPHMGTALRNNEDWAFESRELLHALTVGKAITFASTHSLPPSNDVPRNIGSADINGHALTTPWELPGQQQKAISIVAPDDSLGSSHHEWCWTLQAECLQAGIAYTNRLSGRD